ncbi:MAG TPA: UDP-2,4-diacetamido-2,4,6-trideoxy-beta-L-altropyranose hydrolase [bacterium]
MAKAPALLIRADGNAAIGTGHLMRCLALAQAWRHHGGGAALLAAAVPEAVRTRFIREGIPVAAMPAEPGDPEDAKLTIGAARRAGAAWIVADGYRFGSAYQLAIRRSRFRLLVIDDGRHAEHYYAHVVLNQNPHAEESLYAAREPDTRLLLGPQYALLRREFLQWNEWTREFPARTPRVLVTMGGGDPDNVTARVLEALEALPGRLETVAVAGPANPHAAELERFSKGAKAAVRLERQPAKMPELMSWADLAVSAAGSTVWELAFMGLPAALIVLAENQAPIAERLEAAGVALNLGLADTLTGEAVAGAAGALLGDAARRRGMSARGRALVSGEGASHVAAELANGSR